MLLRRPAGAPELDDATVERLQREHLAFTDRLCAEGTVVTNGPVLDQPDEALRGIGIYRTGSLEEGRRQAERAPLVAAGRIVVDLVPWWCRPGTMMKPGRPITVPEP